MEIMHAHNLRATIKGHRVTRTDLIAVTAAVLSLLTFTILLPGGFHLPW